MFPKSWSMKSNSPGVDLPMPVKADGWTSCCPNLHSIFSISYGVLPLSPTRQATCFYSGAKVPGKSVRPTFFRKSVSPVNSKPDDSKFKHHQCQCLRSNNLIQFDIKWRLTIERVSFPIITCSDVLKPYNSPQSLTMPSPQASWKSPCTQNVTPPKVWPGVSNLGYQVPNFTRNKMTRFLQCTSNSQIY